MDAAIACRLITFSHSRWQIDQIRQIALSVATDSKRLVRVEVVGRDVIATFSATTGPQGA
jgi:hypothetical protein